MPEPTAGTRIDLDEHNPYESPQVEPESVRDQPRDPTRERLRREYMLLAAYVAVAFLLPLAVIWGLSLL